MKTKNKKAISTLIAVTVAFSILVAFSATASATTVEVSPATQNVLPGAAFQVDIYIEDVTYMAGDQATLNFDPTKMQCTGITEGAFLKSGGGTIGIEKIDNTAGTARVAYVLMTPWVGVDGSGVLATIAFTADASASGTFDLTLTDVMLIDGGVTGDWSGGSEIPCTSEDGTVTISRPTEVWVDDDYTSATPGWGYDHFDKIQDGIDAVAGSTVNVADGTYTITAAINVNKGVTITGNVANPENVLVKYNPASSTLNCVEVNSADVTIQGIKVQDCKNGFHFDRAVKTNTGVTISNCIIESVSGWGIGEISSPNTVISHNAITNTGGMGIYIRKCEGTGESNRCEVISNVISGCGAGQPAIQTYVSKYAYIYDNTISSTNDKGINIIQSGATETAERIQVIGNTISGCGYPAIQTDGGKYTYIYDNTISSTNDKGINIIQSGATETAERIQVIGNTISETKWPGIQVIGSPYTYVYSNTLTKCNYYGGDGTGDWDYASIHVQDDGAVSGANVIIDSNTVSDGINGIQLWSDDCTVTNNEIYDMGLTYANTKTTTDGTYYNSAILYGDMYDVNMPTSATINCNNIHDNYWGLFVIDAYTGTVTAECNWWGDDSGPTHSSNIGGSGDAVSDNVAFDPWLTFNPSTSSLVYTGDTIVPYPNAVVLEATLSDSTSTGISGVDVDFYLNNAPVGSNTTDTNGVASLNISTYPVDVYEVRVSDGCGCLEDIGFVAVYDPSAGFVTGGGWIYSDAGAYVPDPGAEGKAAFGFVSKYKKGQQTPTGNTQFQFNTGDLNFHSDNYDWLVIAGHKAMYKGTGTINGDGNYGFMLSAIDEKLTPSTDVDMFRIKIWDKDNGDGIVYDNQMGDSDADDPTTEIAGGQIVIHKAK